MQWISQLQLAVTSRAKCYKKWSPQLKAIEIISKSFPLFTKFERENIIFIADNKKLLWKESLLNEQLFVFLLFEQKKKFNRFSRPFKKMGWKKQKQNSQWFAFLKKKKFWRLSSNLLLIFFGRSKLKCSLVGKKFQNNLFSKWLKKNAAA